MNSFRFLAQGVNAEIERQIGLLRAGEPVVQETLHFDPGTGQLTPLRSKEEAHDYRYFPEPDLVPVLATPEMLEAARAEIPELPAERAARFERELQLSPERAREIAFRTELADYFEAAVAAGTSAGADPVQIANWIQQLVERIGRRRRPSLVEGCPRRTRVARRDGRRQAGQPRRRPRGPQPARAGGR